MIGFGSRVSSPLGKRRTYNARGPLRQRRGPTDATLHEELREELKDCGERSG
jgi:hypothetical protein